MNKGGLIHESPIYVAWVGEAVGETRASHTHATVG
jgi:hypothetical protein